CLVLEIIKISLRSTSLYGLKAVDQSTIQTSKMFTGDFKIPISVGVLMEFW
ncbi:hypothetical protein ACJX0J_024081, partial [Zea mays]